MLEVHPGGKGAAGPGQHPGAQLAVGVELVDRVPDSRRYGQVQGIAGLRPVDDDDLDRAAPLD